MRRAALPAEVDQLRALLLLNGGGGGGGTLAGGANGPLLSNTLARVAFPTVIYIDPMNSSGHASDSNSGASPSAPILTTAHLNALMFARALTADTTVTYMSNDSSGTTLNYDSLLLDGFALDFVGTPALTPVGVFNAGTIAINPSANQRQVVHSSEVAGWVTGTLVKDTTSGAFVWIASTSGANGSATRPMTGPGTPGLFSIGDSFSFSVGTTIALDSMSSVDNNVSFTDFVITSSTGPVSATYNRCSFSSSLWAGGFLNNCYLPEGIFQLTASAILMDAGYLFPGAADNCPGLLFLTDDPYLTGGVWVQSSNCYANVFNSGGVQVQDMGPSVAAGIVVNRIVNWGDQGLYWGNGNIAGVVVLPGSSLTVPKTPGQLPSVTGSGGDFLFIASTGLTTNLGRSWIEATASWTDAGGPPTITTTWANLITAVGSGGFGFNAHDVATSATVVGI